MSKSLSRLGGTGSRRLACVLVAAALVASGCGAPKAKETKKADAGTAVPDKPSSPQTLSIIDVAGNLQLTQPILDDFQKEHPEIVSKIVTTKSTAPELAPKIKAEEAAGRLDIDMVLTGTDGLAAGISQNLWLNLTTDYKSKLPDLDKVYTDESVKMQKLAEGQGVVVTQYPGGPFIQYNPAKVATPPTTAEELLAWAKAHPGKFEYAVPKNSGPGRTLLMGLPYILGDKDPADPTNGWAKTWDYLAQLEQYQPAFPSGTTQTMKDLANGTVDMVASTTGWYMNPIATGQVPDTMKFGTLKGFHFVNDAHYIVVPKGADKDKLSAILNLIKFALQPKEQALVYDSGYFYPGPAVKGVTLDMAPQKSQDIAKKYGGPQMDDLIKNNPQNESLPAGKQVEAFGLWDQKIGANKK
jgi:putative spermidine/putrescine transport system substrate-binding protein